MRGWVKLDDAMPEHPKVARLNATSAWTFVCAIAYCSRNLTDGFIPNAIAFALAEHDGREEPSDVVADLVSAGLWSPTEHGYLIHDYLDYQRSKEEVLSLSATRKAAGAKGGLAKAKQTASKSLAEQEQEQELSLSPRYVAAFKTLAAIGKPGYRESKFTQKRFSELVSQHPEADILVEAERLRDWETYGVGEKQQTRDGIHRLRNWLSKPSKNHEPDEPPDDYSGGTYRRLTPADQAIQ